MKLPSSPKRITWIIGLLCGIAGIVGHFERFKFITEHNYILLMIGFLVLAAGTTLRDF